MINGSNSESMVTLNLDATAAKWSMFARYCSLNNPQKKNVKSCGVVIVLVSTICLCSEFLSCIIGLDVLDKTLVSNVTDG